MPLPQRRRLIGRRLDTHEGEAMAQLKINATVMRPIVLEYSTGQQAGLEIVAKGDQF
jgi:hypothetical protein